MIDLIGWAGSLLFAICGAPQAWKSYKDGHSDGLSHSFIWMWFGGEVLCTVYVIAQPVILIPILFNYLINFGFLVVMIRYKYWPKH